MTSSIWSVLDKYLVRENLIPEQRWVNLYPSEGSILTTNAYGEEEVKGNCVRKSWLRFKLAEYMNQNPGATSADLELGEGKHLVTLELEKKSATSEWIFEEGRRIESTIIQKAMEAGIFYSGHKKFMVPVADGINLVGELDAIFKVEGELCGIEVKSVSGYHSERDIFGTASQRKKGIKGFPRISHLLQTALYAWHYKTVVSKFKIMYFMRGNCLREEFTVEIEADKTNKTWKILVDSEDTGITIEDVFDRYKKLITQLDANTLPDRDFTLLYDDDKMNLLMERNELPRTKEELWKKYWDRKQAGGRSLKRPFHGDSQCGYCQFRTICYDKNLQPIDYDAAAITIQNATVASEALDSEEDIMEDAE